MSHRFVLLLGLLSLGLLAPLPAAPSIEGDYQFVKDTPGGGVPGKHSEIVLSILPRGQLMVCATRPKEVLTSAGTYQLDGERISLELPELDKSVKGGLWKLEGDLLDLPFQLLSDKPGTSRWQRQAPAGGPIAVFYRKPDEEEQRGTPPAQAAAQAAEAAKLQDPLIIGYELTKGVTWCILDFKDGHREWVQISARQEPARTGKQGRSMLAGDPRTHIPARPHTAPDDPPNKTAILFSPFHTAPYYYYDGKGGQGKIGSLVEAGEDLDFLEKRLRSAHYNVVQLVDQEATPIALYQAIVNCGGNPGVLYMSSHGGAGASSAGIMVGVCLGKERAEIHDMSSAFMKNVLATQMPPGYGHLTGHGSLETGEVVNTAWMRRTPGGHLGFLAIMDGFFRRMRKQGTADFGRSLVYTDACSSAANTAFAEALQARAYLGYTDSALAWVSPRLTQYLFSVMWRPTFSITEAMGLMQHVVKNQAILFFPEDQKLAGIPFNEAQLLTLTGADQTTIVPPTFDALYLCWMARWSSGNPEGGAQALLDTYNQYWSKKHFPALASPFATAGVRGKHVPTSEEVDYARHLVSGTPDRPCGRFTLNDGQPVRDKL